MGASPSVFHPPLFLEIGFLSPYFVSQFANRDRYIFPRSLSRLVVLFIKGIFFFSFLCLEIRFVRLSTFLLMTPLVDDFVQWDFQSSSFLMLNITIKNPFRDIQPILAPFEWQSWWTALLGTQLLVGEGEDESSQGGGPIMVM